MASTGIHLHSPMALWRSWVLVGYLLLAMALAISGLASLWSPAEPDSAGTVRQPGCAPGTAQVSGIYPDRVEVGSAAAEVLILGCGFAPSTQVKFNAAPHAALFADASHMRAAVPPADIARAGNLVIALDNGGSEIGSAILHVAPAMLFWRIFGLAMPPVTRELQLLWLVLFAGAFGSCVYALKSLANYHGDSRLYDSWFFYYLIQPFEGAGIAFLLYAVIRGGFLDGASGDRPVNQFSMCAVAGLAGTFSDTAYLKLREVFQILFKPQDDRGGKMSFQIAVGDLPPAIVGQPYRQVLSISGGKAPFRWSVTPDLPADLALDAEGGTIGGIPRVPSRSSHKFTVRDSAATPVSASVDLALEIRPATPPLQTGL